MNTKVSGVPAAPASTGRPRLYVVRDPEPNLRPFEHQAWCTNHSGSSNDDPSIAAGQFCQAEPVELDFGDLGPSDYGFNEARLTLEKYLNLDADEPERTYPTNIFVAAGRHDIAFEVDQAEAFAYALLALVAAERGENTAHDVLREKAHETTVRRPRRIAGAA